MTAPAPAAISSITVLGHLFSYARAGSAATKLAPGDIDPDMVARTPPSFTLAASRAISETARAAVFSLFREARNAGVSTAFDANVRTGCGRCRKRAKHWPKFCR